jgi:hypothetical protein
MIPTESRRFSLDARLGCFGDFDAGDAVCRGRCALRLRCAIERERNLRMEVLEVLVSCEENQPFLQ